MARDERLRPVERIRRRAEFERAYSQGLRIRGRLMTLFVTVNGGVAPRLGIAATKKLGSAVERNRAKRLVREMFRRSKITGGFDIIVVPRREMLGESFANLEADYRATLARRDRSSPRGDSARTGRDCRPRPAQSV